MYKIYCFSFCLWCLLNTAIGQVSTGEWRIHSQSKNAKSLVNIGTTVFAAFDGALLEYDADYNESFSWDITNGLSDLQIATLGIHSGSSSVFVGYVNGNLDQLVNNKVINIPGIKLSGVIGSKKINAIKEHGNFVYLATDFGLVKVDPRRNEIKETFYPSVLNEKIIDVSFLGDSIFALSATRMFKANLNNPALADVSQWDVDTRMPILSDANYTYSDIEVCADSIYFSRRFEGYGKDSTFVVRPSGNAPIIDLGDFAEVINLQVLEGKLVLNCVNLTVIFNPDYSANFSVQVYTSDRPTNTNGVVRVGPELWFADAKFGLLRRKVDGSFQDILFKGPSRNSFFSSSWSDGTLAVVPGVTTGNSESFVQPSVMFFENEEWTSIDRDDQAKWRDGNVWDITSVSVNPTNKNIYALCGFSRTPLSIVDRSLNTVLDTFSTVNAPFTRMSNESIYLSSVKYDENGNLWAINGFDSNPLKLMTPEGEWKSFSLGSGGANKQSRKLFVDYNNTLWAAFSGGGLIGYKAGSDVLSTADDKRVNLTTSEFSGALPTNNVTAIAMDFDNELWIGTDSGFGILYNSESAFDAGAGAYNVQRPKIEIDGETDYVLNNVLINDIEIDGGNRKWFATGNSGMILLSDDGLSIVKHFTMENSPLVSNTILDLEIDHRTGEIFITTELGLMSYRGDATYEDPEYSDVKIFPNPARPEYNGLITIQGIRYNSDIKITDVAGNLVYRTTSNGGTATWNGKTLSGEKAASGVYLIWTASNLVKGRFVGKVVVVN